MGPCHSEADHDRTQPPDDDHRAVRRTRALPLRHGEDDRRVEGSRRSADECAAGEADRQRSFGCHHRRHRDRSDPVVLGDHGTRGGFRECRDHDPGAVGRGDIRCQCGHHGHGADRGVQYDRPCLSAHRHRIFHELRLEARCRAPLWRHAHGTWSDLLWHGSDGLGHGAVAHA